MPLIFRLGLLHPQLSLKSHSQTHCRDSSAIVSPATRRPTYANSRSLAGGTVLGGDGGGTLLEEVHYWIEFKGV